MANDAEPDLVWLCEHLSTDNLASLASLASRCQLPESLRATAWRLFFRVVPPEKPETWATTVADQRELYRFERSKAMERLGEAMAEAIDDGLDDDNAVEDTADQIRRDLERCYPEGAGSHFIEAPRQKMMFHILLVWALKHDQPGYRQGMHELLANVIWAFEKSFAATALAVLPPDSPVNALRVDIAFLEEDAFWLFEKLIAAWLPLYETSGSSSERHHSVIVDMCTRIQKSRLAEADPDLAAHLASFSAVTTNSRVDAVLPQVYMLSWLRLGFSRLLSIDDVAILWDAMFAGPPEDDGEPALLAWLERCAVLLVILQREQLLRADTGTGCLQILLRVVAPDPVFLTRHARRLQTDIVPLISTLRTHATLAAVLPTWLLALLGSIGLVSTPRPSFTPTDDTFSLIASTSSVIGRALAKAHSSVSSTCSCLVVR